MINYWWVTRPKRKLNSIPEILAVLSTVMVNKIVSESNDTQLQLESQLVSHQLAEFLAPLSGLIQRDLSLL